MTLETWFWIGVGVFVVICCVQLVLLIYGRIHPENTIFFGVPMMVAKLGIHLITRIVFLAVFFYLLISVGFFFLRQSQCPSKSLPNTPAAQVELRERVIGSLMWTKWLINGEPMCSITF